MGKNRLEDLFRDPTLERPETDHYRVRLVGFQTLRVTRETAARILAVLGGRGPPRMIRCETLTGSVTYVRSDTVLLVQESTRAQRDAERRFWKEIDDEDEDEEEQPW